MQARFWAANQSQEKQLEVEGNGDVLAENAQAEAPGPDEIRQQLEAG